MPSVKTPNRSGYFAIPTSPDFLLEIAKGNFPGYEVVQVEGFTNGVGTSPQEIWSLGDREPRYTFLTEGTELFLSSSNAGDTQNITITGLDANYILKTATVALSGQSAVSAGTGWLRINFMKNTGTTNLAGEVYLASSGTLTAGVPDDLSKVKSFIRFDTTLNRSDNQSRSLIYSVEAGHTLFLMKQRVAVADLATTADSMCHWRSDRNPDGVEYLINLPYYTMQVEELNFASFARVEEKHDFFATVKNGATSSGTTAMGLDAILVENNEF